MNKFNLILIFLLSSLIALAQESDYYAKALYVYDIAEHTMLPHRPEKEYIITVIGNSEVYQQMAAHLQQRHLYGVPVKFVHIDHVNELNESSIVYLSGNVTSELANVLARTESESAIVICETRGASKAGADFSFVTVAGKLRMDVNSQALAKKNIKVSKALNEILDKAHNAL